MLTLAPSIFRAGTSYKFLLRVLKELDRLGRWLERDYPAAKEAAYFELATLMCEKAGRSDFASFFKEQRQRAVARAQEIASRPKRVYKKTKLPQLEQPLLKPTDAPLRPEERRTRSQGPALAGAGADKK